MSVCLVTGGAGFIGSHLAEALVRRGRTVRVLDNFLTGKRENLAGFSDGIELIEGDIRSLESCRKAVRGADCVFHQAALPSVPKSVADPGTTNEINITGTLNVLLAAKDEGVRRVVLASSSSVYGDDARLPKKEGFEGQPLSPYALSKLVDEHYARLFAEHFGLATVALRYFNIFGPRQDPASQYAAVIPLFITKVLRGESPTVFGDGEQSRDFTYVENVVQANLLAAEAPLAGGEAMNIGCGEPTTILSLIGAVNRLTGAKVEPILAGERPGDIKHSYADVSKARKAIGYEPRVTFLDGLERTIAWYRGTGGA